MDRVVFIRSQFGSGPSAPSRIGGLSALPGNLMGDLEEDCMIIRRQQMRAKAITARKGFAIAITRREWLTLRHGNRRKRC